MEPCASSEAKQLRHIDLVRPTISQTQSNRVPIRSSFDSTLPRANRRSVARRGLRTVGLAHMPFQTVSQTNPRRKSQRSTILPIGRVMVANPLQTSPRQSRHSWRRQTRRRKLGIRMQEGSNGLKRGGQRQGKIDDNWFEAEKTDAYRAEDSSHSRAK